MKKLYLFLLIVLFSACGDETVNVVEQDDNDYYVTVLPAAGSNYFEASFALHVPEVEGNLRAILVLVPGINVDGRIYKDYVLYRDYAIRENVALLACYYSGVEENQNYWRAYGGSGDALLSAINHFATETEIPELKDLPILMWGFSMGGIFTYSFLASYPERLAACTPVRSGNYITEPLDLSYNVPSMFLLGENDESYFNNICINIVKQTRHLGSLWSYGVEPGSGHEYGLSDDLALPFLSKALDLRTDENHRFYYEMKTPLQEDGWLGSVEEREVYSYSDYSGAKSSLVWLPDSSIAYLWRSYIRGELQ